jgi:erythromycin esterase
MAADDYVRGRIDQLDYASALGGGYGESEVTRQTLRWIRDWNLEEGRAHPVSVYGADVSIGDGRSMLPALERLSATVKGDTRVGALIDAVRPMATRLSAAWWGGAVQNYATLAPETKARLTDLVTQLVDAAAAWPAGTAEERAWATRLAILVQQGETMLRLGPRSAENPRDASMAANVRWLVDRLPGDERAIVWAHNAHVQRSAITLEATAPGGVPSMGVHLGRDLGSAYFSIGTAYAGPSMDDGSPPAPGSVDGTLAASLLETPSLLLLRGAPDTGAIGAWLRTERAMRYQAGYLRVPVAAAFDAIAYFDRVEGAPSPPTPQEPASSPAIVR